MLRIHNSNDPDLILIPDYKHNVPLEYKIKPDGIWYGISNTEDYLDNGWRDWLISQGYEDDLDWNKLYNYKIEVLSEDKILKISNPLELKAFRKEYEYTPKYFDNFDPRFIDLVKQVNWNQVKRKYSGIEINSYERKIICEQFIPIPIWYLGWDCNSGCIWDISIINKLKRII